jgi:hypothetical protein
MIKTVTETSPQWKLMLAFFMHQPTVQTEYVKGMTSLSVKSVVYRNLRG